MSTQWVPALYCNYDHPWSPESLSCCDKIDRGATTLHGSLSTSMAPPAALRPRASPQNGIGYTASPVGTFSFYAVLAVEPSLGPAVGGTSVVVSGSGFDAVGVTWTCRFGTTPSPEPASSLSAGQISCASPATTAGTVSVSVSGDGGVSYATHASALFSYYATPSVTAVSPSSGPATGGTAVTLYGIALSAQQGIGIRCRFGGNNPVIATSSSPLIVCNSPIGTGTLPVEVSLNGGADYSSGSTGTFAYVELTSIDPALVPASGGSEVTVTGTGFAQKTLAQTRCRFGPTIEQPASRYIDNVRVVCVAPALPAGAYDMAITTDTSTGYATRPGVSLVAFASPNITSLSPTTGPIAGGTVVTITGTGIPGAVFDPLCRFGTAVVAANVTDAVVTCTAPSGAGSVDVQVSFNGKVGAADLFTAPSQFAYFAVTSLSPSLGPRAGGTVVTVTGEGFSLGAAYTCRLGAGTAIRATVSTTTLACTLPSPLPASARRAITGSLAIAVATEGDITTSPPLSFTLYSDPTITAINPSSLPSSGGPVTLLGTGFLNSTSCRFTGGNASSVVNAPRVSGTTVSVICSAPANPKAVNQAVWVTHNGQDHHVASSDVTFTYTACDPGFFAELDTDPCQPCPPGEYTSTDAARQCDPCPARNYTATSGSTTCSGCPPNTSVRQGKGDALAKCVCDPKFYHPEGLPGERCLACDEGGECPGLTVIPTAKRGFWSSPNDPFTFVPCENPAACPGGQAGRCAEGYTGRMCAECDAGFFKSGTAQCNACPDQAPWILIAFGLFCILLALFLIKAVGKRAKPYTGTLGIATSFFQILAVIGKLGVSWPSSVTDTVRIVTAPFTLDLSILASECSVPAMSYEAKWVLTLLMPVAFALLFAAILGMSKVALTFRGKRGRTIVSRVINAFTLLLSLAYLHLVSTAMELFACTKQRDGAIALVADPSLICYEGWWWRLLPVAIIALIVYGLGIPLTLGWWLRRSKDKLTDPDFALRYGSLYAAYRLDHPYWESVVMLEKAAIAFIGMILTGFVSLQLALLGVLFTVTLVINKGRDVYVRKEDNLLQEVLRWCSLIVLSAGHTFHTKDFPNDTIQSILTVTALICIGGGTLVVLAHVARDLYKVHRAQKVTLPTELVDLMVRVFSPQGYVL